MSLRDLAPSTPAEVVRLHIPPTHNADLAYLMSEVIQHAAGVMSWEALSWSLQSAFETYGRMRAEQAIELLWSGPSPDNRIPVRRIDQTLYDLIARANRKILLVTFAAAKIERLTGELLKAVKRGAKVRLILEFAESSEGQLTFDALKAFPSELVSHGEVYHWPVHKRERNQAGKPGKLHAKFAIIDDVALISSANLTDDAFNRNLELGALVQNDEFVDNANAYFESLMDSGVLERVRV